MMHFIVFWFLETQKYIKMCNQNVFCELILFLAKGLFYFGF
jgi:hypothetical protein